MNSEVDSKVLFFFTSEISLKSLKIEYREKVYVFVFQVRWKTIYLPLVYLAKVDVC
jgi:hypothetical protein